ncbi:MAG: GNAT family N-acetyltransferase [Piscinibacter sp.]
MQLVPASPSDAGPAARCFADAFATDPLIGYFFGDSPAGRAESAERFFSLLLRARLAMAMPIVLARHAQGIVGGAMGYSTVRPEWPVQLQHEWAALEAASPAVADRFAAYESIAAASEPEGPHYYLGVVGVHPGARGTGTGGALVRAFCERSFSDPASAGVYLETANPENLGFYAHHGFVERGSGPLGEGRLWCLFHEHAR